MLELLPKIVTAYWYKNADGQIFEKETYTFLFKDKTTEKLIQIPSAEVTKYHYS